LSPNLQTREREKSGRRGFSGKTSSSGGAMKAFARGKIFVSIAALDFPAVVFKMAA
jgi:hypothetical protein